MSLLKKIATVAVVAMLGLGFAELAAHAHNPMIKGLLLLPVGIALWWVSSNDDLDESGQSATDGFAGRVVLVYGLGASVFLIAIGALGLSVAEGDWVSSLRYALPFGGLAIVALFIAIWRRSQ